MFSRSAALAWAAARLAATPERTRPHTSASQVASSGTTKSPYDADEGDVGRCPEGSTCEIDGDTVTCGYSCERAPRIAARASSNLAAAIFKLSLETLTCASSAFRPSSPNISHQLPRRLPSSGC